MKYNIVKYNPKYQPAWDDLIDRSANGTFLHKRAYMDYHAHRFTDYSLLIFEEKKLRAVLPAHQVKLQVVAHNGLTYSDIIFQKKLKFEHKAGIVKEVLQYLFEQKIKSLYIKNIPFIYQTVIDQSNDYIYFQTQASIKLIKPFFVMFKDNGYKPNRNRLKNLKKLDISNYTLVSGLEHLTDFWQIVENNLQRRYQTRPVHNLKEIQLLMNRFPEQIKFYGLIQNNKMLAGALVYLVNKAMHFQYIHSVAGHKERKAVEWLTYRVIQKFSNYNYISFGSSEVSGNNLNSGLVYWKESFNSRIINQLHFEIQTAQYKSLNDLLQ